MIPTLQLGGLGRAMMGSAPSLLDQVKTAWASYSAAGGIYYYSPSTCFTDTARTTPAGIGDNVAGITDQCGAGNHWSQATVAKQPLLQQDGNGNYYLDFDGTDDLITSGDVFTLGMPVYLATALDRTGSGSGELYVALSSNSNNHTTLSGTTGDKGRAYLRHGTLGQVIAIEPTGTLDSGVHVLDSQSIAGTTDVAVDGETPITISNAWTTETVASAVFGVSSSNGTGPAFAHRNYGAILLLDQPSSGDRDLFQQWLASLNGATLI